MSFIFHPLIMPTLSMFIVLHSGTALSVLQSQVIKMTLIIMALFMFLFPAILIMFLFITKVIQDIELHNARDRILTMVLILIMYVFTLFILWRIPQLTRTHVFFTLCAPIVLLLLILLRRIVNPSIHMSGIGHFSGVVFIMILYYGAAIQGVFIASVLIAGLLGTSRLILKEGSWQDVGIGFFTGFLPTLLIMMISNI